MTSDASAWTDGWWNGATRRASPNFDTRPAETQVKLVVLHHISLPAGQFEGDAVGDFFENRLDVERYPMLSGQPIGRCETPQPKHFSRSGAWRDRADRW